MSTASEMTPDDDPRPCRWQTIGYPIFADFVASDNEFFLLRRFGALNARIILALQDEICQLEEELKRLDDEYMRSAEPVNNGSFRQDVKEDRIAVIKELKRKLKEYNEFVVLHGELKVRPQAGTRLIENIRNWHAKNEGAILEAERDYICEEEDLITIVPSSKTPLQHALEHTDWFSTSRLFRRRPRNKAFYDEEAIFYQSKTRVWLFDTVIVLLIGLAMLLIPIWILDLLVKSTSARLGVISAFISLFLFGVQMVTGARPGETLAATAAYSAVLVVFLQAASASAN